MFANWDVRREGTVIQVNPYRLYWLGGEVEKIGLLNIFVEKRDGPNVVFLLKLFRLSLQEMTKQDEVLLPGCRLQAEILLREIHAVVLTADTESSSGKIPDLFRFNEAFDNFRKFLEVGLSQVDLFQLQHRGMHDPKRLLFGPRSSFSDRHWKCLSDAAQQDWTAASECLAYGVATACGFHSLRARRS